MTTKRQLKAKIGNVLKAMADLQAAFDSLNLETRHGELFEDKFFKSKFEEVRENLHDLTEELEA